MEKNNILLGKRIFFAFAVVSLFFAALLQVSSDEEKARYSDLEKEEIEEDKESQELLREYYGDMLGYVGTSTQFNTIATKGDIAILNVTIDGNDRRILTRLRKSTLFPGQGADLTNAKLIRTENLVVLGNISLKGILFSEVDGLYASRKLFGVESTRLRYFDEGISRLVNGEARVSINPILRELISGYNVFLSAQGLTKGLYVAEKSNAYFVVRSANHNSNIAFSWMLSGLRKGYDEGYLASLYGIEKGIEITATINYENESTYIKISGLREILALADETAEDIAVNESGNNTNNNQTDNNNSNINDNGNNQGIKLVTGNLVDEFGLETDLGQILSDTAPTLPAIGDGNQGSTINNNRDGNNINNNPLNNENNNSNIDGIDNNLINDSNNQTTSDEPVISTLEFTLYSVDEDLIVEQVSSVTGLSSAEVRKLVSFVYKEPEGFYDEAVDSGLEVDFIEKVNGSVIIKLG